MIEVQSRTSCEDLIKEKDKEIGKLVDELEEQERHIKEANAEIERLQNIIKQAIETIDIYGTSKYETADLLYAILKGEKNAK